MSPRAVPSAIHGRVLSCWDTGGPLRDGTQTPGARVCLTVPCKFPPRTPTPRNRRGSLFLVHSPPAHLTASRGPSHTTKVYWESDCRTWYPEGSRANDIWRYGVNNPVLYDCPCLATWLYCKATEMLRKASCPYYRRFRSSMLAQMTSLRLSVIQVTFHFTLLGANLSDKVMQPRTCERYTSSIHSLALICLALMEHLTTAPTTTQTPRNIVRHFTQRLELSCSLDDYLAHIHRLDRTLPDPAS